MRILGEYRGTNVTHILSRKTVFELSGNYPPFELKTVVFKRFPTLESAKKYIDQQGIVMQYFSDTETTN